MLGVLFFMVSCSVVVVSGVVLVSKFCMWLLVWGFCVILCYWFCVLCVFRCVVLCVLV